MTVSHLASSDASGELVRNELVQLLLVQMILGGEIWQLCQFKVSAPQKIWNILHG